MSLTFTCDCGALCRVDDEQIGRTFVCWKCGAQTIARRASAALETHASSDSHVFLESGSERRRRPRSRITAPPLALLKSIRRRLQMHMSVLRWVLLGLYLVMVAVMFLLSWHGLDRLLTLILAVVMLGAQCLLIFGGGTMQLTRPIRKRRLWMPALAAALMGGVLAGGLYLALAELFFFDGPDEFPLWPVFWVLVIGNWLLWFVLILLATRATPRMKTLTRIAGGLLAGSLAELLAAVPAHMIVSRRPGCFVGILTMWGIFAGLYVMLFAMGPGIVLLFLHPRYRREQVEGAPALTAPWYRFRLRTMFLIIMLCSLPCAWLAYELNKARANRKLEAQLQEEIVRFESVGGSAETSYDVHPDSLDQLTGNPGLRYVSSVDGKAKFDDNSLRELQHLRRLQSLDMGFTQVTDAGLVVLEGFPELYYLNLENTNVTDAGLAHARDLKALRELNLNNTSISDAGLAHLKDLPNVWELSLSNTQVTDRGLAHLRDWEHLFFLDLSNTQVTDAGLEHLWKLDLVILDLTNTHVTPTGISRFRKEVPHCTVGP